MTLAQTPQCVKVCFLYQELLRGSRLWVWAGKLAERLCPLPPQKNTKQCEDARVDFLRVLLARVYFLGEGGEHLQLLEPFFDSHRRNVNNFGAPNPRIINITKNLGLLALYWKEVH